jgi:hypothetical protein
MNEIANVCATVPKETRRETMKIYLITCYCKDDDSIWKNKALVKAKNAFQAWEKFREKWIKELDQGKADIPLSSISEYSVEDEAKAVLAFMSSIDEVKKIFGSDKTITDVMF